MGLSLSLAIIVAVLVHETIQRPKTQFNLGFFDTSLPLPVAFSLREQLEEINVSSMGFAADNQRGSESFPKLRSQSGYNNQKAAATLILNFYLLRIRRRPHRALKSPATTLGEI